MLVVVAIVAILTTMVIGIASRIENREKEKHCRSSLALLTTALAQFHEYGFDYKGNYTEFAFPLDCNGFGGIPIRGTLGDALGVGSERVIFNDPNASYAGDEVMYLLLNMVPSSQETLAKIDRKLIAVRNGTITIDTRVYPLLRIIDPWGIALRYDYYDEWETDVDKRNKSKRNFPLVISAGPDKSFGTDDDITSR
jgi:type II secretory pathway pseudopilin PulG